MAIAPIHPAPPLTAAEGVRQVQTVLDRCGPVDGLSGYAASSLVADVDRAVTRLQAVKLALLAVVAKSDVASDAGMTGTAAWLAARSRRDGACAAPSGPRSSSPWWRSANASTPRRCAAR